MYFAWAKEKCTIYKCDYCENLQLYIRFRIHVLALTNQIRVFCKYDLNGYLQVHFTSTMHIIIESVDSISRDGPDCPYM